MANPGPCWAPLFCFLVVLSRSCHGFVAGPRPVSIHKDYPGKRIPVLSANKGFGDAGGGFGSKPAKKSTGKKNKRRLQDTLDDKPSAKKKASANKPFIKSEQDDLIESLAAASSKTRIGQAVASSPLSGTPDSDPFWELMPSLINSRFPNVPDEQFERVAGFVRHTLDPNLPLEDEIISNPHRPQDEIHAYMPGLGATQPFLDPNQLELCKLMSENYETIRNEYDALVQDIENGGKDRFQSVTSMNYESGWKTLVLFYNGHRIPNFPYHLCPVTTKILETVPLAGRIAGFNRQQPNSGIPLHTDGNNMWLTCQMGIYVPEGRGYQRISFTVVAVLRLSTHVLFLASRSSRLHSCRP